jgi:hypothetical protein
MESLERRDTPSVTSLTLSASPQILRPINPRLQPRAVALQHVVPVTLAGEVTTTGDVAALRYQVIDSYGLDQPGGPIVPQPLEPGRAFYSIRIGLADHRIPHNPRERQYTVVVTADDTNGSTEASVVVTVPPVGFYHRPKT